MATGVARLAGELTGASAPANTPRCWFEPGVVQAVVSGYGDDTTITVRWRNADLPASYLSPYIPVEGDVVLLMIQPPSVVVFGRIIGPEESS